MFLKKHKLFFFAVALILPFYQNCSSLESNKIEINSSTISSQTNTEADAIIDINMGFQERSEANNPPPGNNTEIEPSTKELVTTNFSISEKNILNPDRGWYVFTSLLSNNNYKSYVDQGYRLAYSALTLGRFINSEIDQSTLSLLEQRFGQMRTAGIKAVLRVNYSERDGGPTATFTRIEQHMKQLKPIIEKNKDVIAYIEAGYMGPWGEWHFFEVPNPPFQDKKDSWKKLIDLLLANNPKDKFVMIRYPSKKEEIFSGKNITQEQAFSENDIARIGHHNDCFVSSNDDVGTYQLGHSSYSNSIEDQKKYLEKDTKYSPIGGESCALHSRSKCGTALQELKRFGYTYLNAGYFTAVINRWKAEGCYDEINKKLGYRLFVKEFKMPKKLIRGKNNTFSLTLANSGFSRPWYSRTVYLRGLSNGQEAFRININDLDIRELTSNTSKTLVFEAKLPEQLPAELSLTLWLPDAKESNHDNSNYSIRLANKNTWNQSQGDNTIVQSIQTITK